MNDRERRIKIKICCISSQEEAALAVDCGADYIGLVSAMPSGPGPIKEELIARIATTASKEVKTVLLTCKTTANEIIRQHKYCQTSAIQLVDAVPQDVYIKLRDDLPGIEIIQVIHVTDEKSIADALTCADFCDMVLLDSGNPNLAVKELGGTGRVHDWAISRKIVEECPKPVFLAGGLNPANVRSAIKSVRPYGVDICSGVRTNGKLDLETLRLFMKAAASI